MADNLINFKPSSAKSWIVPQKAGLFRKKLDCSGTQDKDHMIHLRLKSQQN